VPDIGKLSEQKRAHEHAQPKRRGEIVFDHGRGIDPAWRIKACGQIQRQDTKPERERRVSCPSYTLTVEVEAVARRNASRVQTVPRRGLERLRDAIADTDLLERLHLPLLDHEREPGLGRSRTYHERSGL
jgi:hypothetical protein